MESEEEDGEGDREGWMDAGGEDEIAPTKRVKTNFGGGVINKREPRSNRQTAGMRDEGQFTRATKLRNLGQRPRNMLAKAGEGGRVIKTKMPKHLFAGKRKGGKTQRR